MGFKDNDRPGFISSHSSLQQFRTCPRQYYHARVLKDLPFTTNEAAAWGTEVHKALELRLLEGQKLPTNMVQYEKYAAAVEAIPGERFCEHKMGMKADLSPCDFFDKDGWFRGVVDVLIVNRAEGTAHAIDWKLGKRVQDDEQAKLMAALIMSNFPEIVEVKTAWLYLAIKEGKKKSYTRDSHDFLLRRARTTISDIVWAGKNNSWPQNPSGLCGKYCGVTSCRYNGAYKGD